jgi:tRNA modification GTPase
MGSVGDGPSSRTRSTFSGMIQSAKDDPIVALATPPGRSAIALIRGSGGGSIEALGQLFDRPEALRRAPGHSSVVGYLSNREGSKRLDQVAVTVYRGPRSYTGEDAFEIGCHGNPQGVQRILEELLRIGFRSAEPGEFTLRAFLSGKIDLTQAEAVHEVVTARTDRGRELALERLDGSIRREIDSIKEELVGLMAQVNVQLDYGEDEVEEVPLDPIRLTGVLEKIRRLLSTYRNGRLFQEGATVVLAGAPNVGKSSLFNAMIQEERAITDPTPGTTRDYLEVALDIRGIPIRLFDTAGIRRMPERSTEGEGHAGIERRGIELSGRLVDRADLVIRVFDAREALRLGEASAVVPQGPDKHPREIRVYNKADLLSEGEFDALNQYPAILLSATTHRGLADLETAVVRSLGDDQTPGDSIMDSPRQKALLEEAADALEEARRGLSEGVTIDLVAEDLQASLAALGQITGEVTSSDLLERMFSSFCLGK